MAEEEKNPNPIFLVSDLLEEIFLRLPLKSVLRFKTVSTRCRSILESRRFVEKHMNLHKDRKILVAGDYRIESRFEPMDKEIEFFYFQFEDVTRPSLTCDGLVCILLPDSVKVLNPFTGQFISFASGPDPRPEPVTNRYDRERFENRWNVLPEIYAVGFGKDKVNGSYKVVRMLFSGNFYCEILDVNIGEWRKLANPSLYKVDAKRKSACVNGSIYWLVVKLDCNVGLLALDLHTEEFRNVPPPSKCMLGDQVVNLEDRLAIARMTMKCVWELEIWCIDAQEERWSMFYSISLLHHLLSPPTCTWWFRPVAVSKQGNLFFYDNDKRLFKYYPEKERDELCCLSPNICVISPIVENLIPLPRPSFVPKTSEHRSGSPNRWSTPQAPVFPSFLDG